MSLAVSAPGAFHLESVPEHDRAPSTYESAKCRRSIEKILTGTAAAAGDADDLVDIEKVLAREMHRVTILAASLASAHKTLKTTEDGLEA